MNLEHPLGQPEELAALFAAGAMPEHEQREFLEHLAVGCSACARYLAGYLDLLQLTEAGAVQILRRTMLGRATADTELRRESSTGAQESTQTTLLELPLAQQHDPQPATTSDCPACYIVPAAAGSWEPTGHVGVKIRQLYVDRVRRQYTALVRMEPGAIFPAHQHEAAEECLVLEGDLCFGDKVLSAGDFLRTAPGFRQEEQRTQEGCLLYITSPVD